MIYSFGHSTLPIETFVEVVRSFGVRIIFDVRTVPRSRHNPQFNQDLFAKTLRDAGIEYMHMKGLGGWRRPRPDSINTAWKNSSFRGYADYMQTETFERNLQQLIAYGQQEQRLILCAESLPWKCHRMLIADALIVRGIRVEHILGIGKTIPHELTKTAEVIGPRITYNRGPGPQSAGFSSDSQKD